MKFSKRKKNYYDMLDIPQDANPAEILSAWKEMAKKYHPDVNKDPEATERMKEINHAYQVLSNEQRRNKYDFETFHENDPMPEPKPSSGESGKVSWKNKIDNIDWKNRITGFFAVSAFIILSILIAQTIMENGNNNNQETPPLFPVPERSTVYIDIKGSQFDPPELKVIKGTSVRWTNMDSAQHIINGQEFMSLPLNKRDSWNFTFMDPGVFRYICSIHPSISPGTIIVE